MKAEIKKWKKRRNSLNEAKSIKKKKFLKRRQK
jgi:hypothetical protein